MASDPQTVRKMVQRVKSLPTLPGVVKELCAMVEDETTSAEEVGRMIGTDQVLSAKVLKMVNSSFYGFPGRISTVTHALVLLGFNVVKGIVLSASVVDIMLDGFKGLWEHSCACSYIGGKLARHLSIPDPEEISVAGLLHDLGKVIIALEMKEEFKAIQNHQRMARVLIREAEEEVLGGVNHADITAWLAEDWQLPVRLVEPLRLHHLPTEAKHAPRQTAAVHLSDILTRAHGFGYAGDNFIPKLNPKALDALGMTWDDLDKFVADLPAELADLDTSIFS